MIGVTNHFVERYAERILGMSSADAKSYVKPVNNEIVSEWANSLTLNFIIQAEFHGNTDNNYWWAKHENKNLIIVTNNSNQAFVTLFFVEFGLGENINNFAFSDILGNIENYKKDIETAESHAQENSEKILSEIQLVEAEIKSLEEQLDVAKSWLNLQKALLNNTREEVKKAEEIYKREAYKIIYSCNYNLDRMSYKGGK